MDNVNIKSSIPEIWPPREASSQETMNKEILWDERRRQIIDLLCEEQYGFLPPAPLKLSFTDTETNFEFCAGKAPLRRVSLNMTLSNGNLFSLPVSVVIPKTESQSEKIPFFVYISFDADVPGKFLPSEEIADNGFAVLSFNYQDAASDDDNFKNGLSEALGYSDNNTCGKIALWAWAALRVMDYACTLTQLNKTRAAIAGHSRLGKTALLAGAVDTRFSYIISNNSGCCGAAVSRGKKGETIRNITNRFLFWFKNSFKKYADNEDALPFDQHFLLAACAPRRIYVSSSSDDLWADPDAEFLGCKLAGSIWDDLGLPSFICGNETQCAPVTGKLYHGGRVAYHKRKGAHYLGREDWQYFMKYIIASL